MTARNFDLRRRVHGAGGAEDGGGSVRSSLIKMREVRTVVGIIAFVEMIETAFPAWFLWTMLRGFRLPLTVHDKLLMPAPIICAFFLLVALGSALVAPRDGQTRA